MEGLAAVCRTFRLSWHSEGAFVELINFSTTRSTIDRLFVLSPSSRGQLTSTSARKGNSFPSHQSSVRKGHGGCPSPHRLPSAFISEALPSDLDQVVQPSFRSTPRKNVKDMSYSELEDWVVKDLDEEPKRARMLWTWLYRDKHWASHPSQMEGVSMKFRAQLAGCATFDSLILDGVKSAKDGTRKVTFRLPEEGSGIIETVLIPHPSDDRNTLCVSSQLGCAMNCSFCFTAKMGLQRNLSAGQIVDQLVQVRRLFTKDVGPITNIVFMRPAHRWLQGMGEPLHNLDNVLRAIDIMVDNTGLHCSPRRITVSTSGLVPEIRRFCTESPASLAVSLNASTDEVRNWIMPINRRYNLSTLLSCLEEEFPRSMRQSKVFFEYIMLDGINDSLEDARRVLELTKNIPCKINLIVFNPHAGTEFRPSPMERVLAFRDTLIQGNRLVFIRQSRGDDEMAACGQLGQPGLRKLVRDAEVSKMGDGVAIISA
eukprot:jgi/Mesen1/2783/ME000170S01902